jgi:hypothetical protein
VLNAQLAAIVARGDRQACAKDETFDVARERLENCCDTS